MMIRSLITAGLLLGLGAPAFAQQRVRVLVAYHSVTGNTEKMALAVAEGARSSDALVIVKNVADVTRADLEQTDALIVGSPTQWSNLTAATKAFIEAWPDMVDKIGGAFATGGAASGGKEHVVTSIVNAMLSHGMIVAGPVYSEGSFRFGANGATATTGPGSEGVSESELDEARALGKRVAAFAQRVGPQPHAAVSANVCETGREQSPIDLGEAKPSSTPLPQLQFGYRQSPATVVKNDHGVTATMRDTLMLRIGDAEYRLLQFHYHDPAEHLVAGKRAELEVHLVHVNSKGELAVVGVMVAEGAANQALSRMVSGIGRETTIDPRQLLPAHRSYVTYAGSLTTPPCSEGVRWLVLEQPLAASRRQIDELKDLVEDNARPVQKAGSRTVRRSSGN